MNEIFKYVAPRIRQNAPCEVYLAGITYPDANYYKYRACSTHYVIEYVLDGEGTVIVENEIYHIQKGDLYILKTGEQHEYYSSKKNPWTKIWINVAGSLCKAILEAYGIYNKTHFKNFNSPEILQEFLDFCETTNERSAIDETCAICFLKIAKRLSENESTHIPLSIEEKIKNYISEYFYEKMTVTDLSEKFGISVTHLNRLFKKRYNKTVYSYILECKLEAAKHLLSDTQTPIKIISDKLNFADEHYFCSIFKKKFNQTPLRYRKESQPWQSN